MEFRFISEIPASKADHVVDLMAGPRLWVPQAHYPDIQEWGEKSHREIVRGEKRGIIATSQRKLVASLLYQRHKTRPGVVEGRNITVKPEHWGRHVADFMLTNAEIEAANDFPDCQIMIWDAKVDNAAMNNLFASHGYEPEGAPVDLYRKGAGLDVIWVKPIGQKKRRYYALLDK